MKSCESENLCVKKRTLPVTRQLSRGVSSRADFTSKHFEQATFDERKILGWIQDQPSQKILQKRLQKKNDRSVKILLHLPLQISLIRNAVQKLLIYRVTQTPIYSTNSTFHFNICIYNSSLSTSSSFAYRPIYLLFILVHSLFR